MLSRFVQRYYVLHGCHVLLFVLLRFVPAMRNMLLSTSLPDGPTSVSCIGKRAQLASSGPGLGN